jgi:hypothetical protein
MHQVVYSSAAVQAFTEAELVDLLAKARINNERLGITGLLLYDDGSFLQVLEGDDRVIEALYEKIGRDKRHHRVVALLRREVPERHFAKWQMGFVAMNASSKHIPGYSQYWQTRTEPAAAASAASRLLESFRDGRLLRCYLIRSVIGPPDGCVRPCTDRQLVV